MVLEDSGVSQGSSRAQSVRRASLAYAEGLRRNSIAQKQRPAVRRPNQLEQRALSGIWKHTLVDIAKFGRSGLPQIEASEGKPACELSNVQSASPNSSSRDAGLRQTIVNAFPRGSTLRAKSVPLVASPYLSVVKSGGPVASVNVWQNSDEEKPTGTSKLTKEQQTKLKRSHLLKPPSASSKGSVRLSTTKRSGGSHPSTAAEWEEQDRAKQENAQHKRDEEQWLLAREAERGNAWKVLELLQAGIEASSIDEAGRTACHFAAMNNHQQSLLALCFVDQDAYVSHDFEQQAHDGGTALHYAAFNGCFQAVDTLVERHRRKIQKDRTDILDKHKEDAQETRQAIRGKRDELRELETDLEELRTQEAAMSAAIENHNQATVDGKADHHKKRKEMRARQGALEADLDAQAEGCGKLEQAVAHWKPISRAKHEAFKASLAVATKELTAAQQALEQHVKDAEGQEKEYAKAMRKHARGVVKAEKKLLQVERTLPVREEEVAACRREVASLARRREGIREQIKEYSRKVVVFPASHAHVEFNATVHGRGADGATPLHWAAQSGQDGMARRLIEQGGNMHAADNDGMTPLHWAAAATSDPRRIPSPRVLGRHVEVGVVLLSAGADANARDAAGCTAMHVAASRGFTWFVRLLKEWDGDSKVASDAGQVPAHFAMAAGEMACAGAVLHDERDLVAALHATDAQGLSALQIATLNGHAREAVELLKTCTRRLEDNVQEAKTQARRGFRDEPHKTMKQSYGPQILTGSMAESLMYAHSSLAPTRSTGWDRNDLVHMRSAEPAPDRHTPHTTAVEGSSRGSEVSRRGVRQPSVWGAGKAESTVTSLSGSLEKAWTAGLAECTLRAMGIDLDAEKQPSAVIIEHHSE